MGRPIALILAPILAFLAPGCEQSERREAGTTADALSSNATSVLGFERTTDWRVTSSPTVALSSSTTHSQGTASLAVKARNYVAIQSANISVNSAIAGPFTYDLQLPPPSNPFWAGATQLFINCPSHGLFNQYLGQFELTNQPVGSFLTMTYSVPSVTATALNHGCGDLSFVVVLNTPSDSTGTYLLDNFQLDGPPVLTACNQVTPPADGGAVASGFAFSTRLNRPDVGVFTLDEMFTPEGATSGGTTVVQLNGQSLIEATETLGSGTTTTTTHFFPPLGGIVDVSSISDGVTFTLTVDGRQTVPAPVGTDPGSIRFVDGGPVPKLVVSAPIRDAVAELLNDVAAESTACRNSLAAQTSSVATPAPASSTIPPTFTLGPDPDPCFHCELVCDGELLGCDAGGLLAGLANIFAGEGVLVGCGVEQVRCISACHRAETACCPVGCGNVGAFSQPTCCAIGDSCLKQGDFSHVGLCCPSGSSPCGGDECCGPDQTCNPRTHPAPNEAPAFCCGAPGETKCGNFCCGSGQGCAPNGQSCCTACTTDAQCGGPVGESFCVNGCCQNG
jgi:hypothetical protein